MEKNPGGRASSDVCSMGDLQEPTDGGTIVPYKRPYFVGICGDIPLHGLNKHALHMVGTSNLGSCVMATLLKYWRSWKLSTFFWV